MLWDLQKNTKYVLTYPAGSGCVFEILMFAKNSKKKQQKQAIFTINMTEFQKNSQPPILLYMLPKFFLRQFHMSRLWEKYQCYDRRPPAFFFQKF